MFCLCSSLDGVAEGCGQTGVRVRVRMRVRPMIGDVPEGPTLTQRDDKGQVRLRLRIG